MCKQEAVEKSLILSICGADKRTPEYCGVLVGTITGIRKESKKRSEGSLLHKPEKNRAQEPERSVIIEEFDLCVVRIKENFFNL